MKSQLKRKLDEANPAMDGAKAARLDNLAHKDKNRPFAYYHDVFWDLETQRQALIDLKYKYKDQNFMKAAILVEKAQNAMLKAGR